MPQFHWQNAPAAIVEQAQNLVRGLREMLSDNLVGIYLHGSLAMGCFNPNRSDLDILVVTDEYTPLTIKCQVAELLLGLSNNPSPIEISFLAQTELIPWKFPTPFDFHYSETWRTQTGMDLVSGEWKNWNKRSLKDPDLAAHVTITLHRGIVLWGASISSLIPQVPTVDYLTAIWEHDTKGAAQTIVKDPIDTILNLCRILLFLCEKRVASKDEGGSWACDVLPKEFQKVVQHALYLYRGDAVEQRLDPVDFERFAAYVSERIQNQISPASS